MNTRIVSIGAPDAIESALEVLHSGGILAFPTDTVYGIGVSAFSYAGIDKMYEIKERSLTKAIPVLVANFEQIELISPGLPQSARLLARHFWPGALTLVIPRLPGLPENLSPTTSIGVRIPDHAFTLRLMETCGPLAATSANLSGCEETHTPSEVLVQLAGRVELLFDGGRTPGGLPSSVVDCTGEKAKILRLGSITAEQLTSVAGIDWLEQGLPG